MRSYFTLQKLTQNVVRLEFVNVEELADLGLDRSCLQVYDDAALECDRQIGMFAVVETLVRLVLKSLFLVRPDEAAGPDHHGRPEYDFAVSDGRLALLEAYA